jgi:endonuclease III
MARRPSLTSVVEALEGAYGRPPKPPTTDPWEAILRVNVVYLADEEQRDAAFKVLKKDVGVRPRDILAASPLTLLRISGLAGILAENSARKVRQAAEIAETEFGGNLKPVLDLPTPQAKRALKKFPGIGDPGAEKLLLFAGRLPVLAPESNALRVLVRLGFAPEGGAYAATYRTAQANALESAPKDPPWLVKAHQLLKIHGQQTCKQSRPLCEKCVLNRVCPYPRRAL